MCSGIRTGADGDFDLDGNGTVEMEDLDFLVQDILRAGIGDVNLDGVFNSSDLVQIFSSGEYEDGVAANSNWSTGDWNCDGEFSSTDLVAAFQAGSYSVVGARPTTSAIAAAIFGR